MEALSVKTLDMYRGLRDKFLFSNDINSIYILLALYDLEENISSIYPKYMSKHDIKKKIKFVLTNRDDSEIISRSISDIIHEDINRLELCFYLEGYKHGYTNKKWTNILEKKALDLYGLEGIYKKTHLFHFNTSDQSINDMKKKCKREIDNKERIDRYIESLVYTFTNKIIKKKIVELDRYINKQLRMSFECNDIHIREEKHYLQEEEIDKVYFSIVKALIKKMKIIYKEAFWYAVNDKVLVMYY
ncbi:hypothetical protein [Proteiniborus sp. MB09-C3]|uniref:hypothetical protein n=1 Tax=Proteiniborus sp. MB09-C3 TaxID=3050072 RepID=UPI002552BD81|nr:hypothetical protein [Proteiniborus sp. MB09-C3]WIV10743.1 hypothetical protein QO263_11300 [Proteiniborus sp. MB09-C3]